MYNSVTEFFEKEYPNLVGALDRPGGFWPVVKDNTIPNAELDLVMGVNEATGRTQSDTYRGAVALMRARMLGKLPNPG